MGWDKKRAHSRFALGVDIQLTGEGRTAPGVAINVSPGGLRVSTDLTADPGDELRVLLPLRNHGKRGALFCTLTGHVVWANRPAIGVAFADMAVDMWAEITRLIETLSPVPAALTDRVLEAPAPFEVLPIKPPPLPAGARLPVRGKPARRLDPALLSRIANIATNARRPPRG